MVNRLCRFTIAIKHAQKVIEDTLFSRNCILCGTDSRREIDLCSNCEQDLPWQDSYCQRCALPLASAHSALCGHCLQAPPAFHYAHTVWIYTPPVAQLIHAFKYRRRYYYGTVLASLAAASIAKRYTTKTKPDYLVATPLHWRRYISRGFNQSEYICNHLSRQLSIAIYHGVKRIKATPKQQSLNAILRRFNITGAFSITNPSIIQGKSIAIVDDVLTTGATANELAQSLLAAGATQIHVWCLARTPR